MKWENSSYSKVCQTCFDGDAAKMREYAKNYLAKGPDLAKPLGKPFRNIVKTRNRRKWWMQADIALNKHINTPNVVNVSVKSFKVDRSYHSAYFEKLTEHLFLADLLRYSIKAQKPLIEISKPEADVFGYDMVLRRDQITRHVQVKSSIATGKVQYHKVHENLKNYPSACVVWAVIDDNLDLKYRFFGNNPGKPIPDLLKYPYARHEKRNKKGERTQRKNIRKVPTKEFEKPVGIEDLSVKLFGK